MPNKNNEDKYINGQYNDDSLLGRVKNAVVNKMQATPFSQFADTMMNNAIIATAKPQEQPLYDMPEAEQPATNTTAPTQTVQPAPVQTEQTPAENVKAAIGNVLTETYSSGKLSAEDYAARYGTYDPTAYRQTEAQIDYEWKKALSSYGQNAEYLAQMGLSGSGVSDAYASSAYAAMVKAKSQLKIDEINARKAARSEYAVYSDEFDQKQESNIVNAYNALISSGRLTGNEGSIQSLVSELVNQGYTKYEAEEAAKRVRSLDPARFKSERTLNGYALIAGRYGETEEAKKAMVDTLKASGYGATEIKRILKYAQDQYDGAASTVTDEEKLKTLGVSDIKTALELANTYEENEDVDSLQALYNMLVSAGYSEEQLEDIFWKAKKLMDGGQ